MLTYYLRFLKVLLLGPRNKQILVGEQTCLKFRCWPTECEYLRTMNGALLISLVEISEQLNNLTTRFFQTAVKDKIWPVTRRYWANYKKPVRVFQKGEVRTRLAWWDDTSVLWYSEVWVKGQLCTQVVAHVLVIDKKKKYSIPDVQRRMGMKVDSPSLTPEVLEVIQGWSPLQTSK